MSCPALHQIRAVRHPVIGVMLFLLFLVQTLAASNALHEDVHSDAAASDHSCAVTLFSSGQVDLHAPAALLPQPAPEFVLLTWVCDAFIAEPADFLLPSRGPPSLA